MTQVNASRGELRGVAPVLLVTDVVRSAGYYADALGFAVPRMWGEPPRFCVPRRDNLAVMLNQVAPGTVFRPNASYDGRYDAYFYVTDADALFREFQDRGAEIVAAPDDEPYGMREFAVRDPDGHLLAFGQDISRPTPHA